MQGDGLVDTVSSLMGTGTGFAALAFAILAQTIVLGVWAGRVSEALKNIPKLRDSAHEAGNAIARNSGRIDKHADRIQSHGQSIRRIYERLDSVSRLDEKMTAVLDRLVRIENALERRGEQP